MLQSFKDRAKLVAETFNSMEGIKCNEVMGAMYAFPNVSIPKRAQEEAKVNDNYLIWTLDDLVLKIRILWSPLQCTLQSEHVVWQIQTSAVTLILDDEFFTLMKSSDQVVITFLWQSPKMVLFRITLTLNHSTTRAILQSFYFPCKTPMLPNLCTVLYTFLMELTK